MIAKSGRSGMGGSNEDRSVNLYTAVLWVFNSRLAREPCTMKNKKKRMQGARSKAG